MTLPRGYLSVPDATALAAKMWNSREFARATLTPDEALLLEEHRRSVREQEELAARTLGALLGGQAPGLGSRRSGAATAKSSEIERAIEKEAEHSSLIRKTWETLRDEMYEGRLPGYAFHMQDGKITPLPPNVWRSSSLDDGCFNLAARFFVDHTHFVAVGCLRETELMAMLEGRPIVASIVDERNPGGRPAKYDSEAFLIEAFCILWEEAQPKSQAELRRRTIDAYDANSAIKAKKHPPDDWAKLKIRRLWNRLQLGNKG
jgi:hypothetical protein